MASNMNITEIYAEFEIGSTSFIRAVQSHCGFNCSDEEIERIAKRAANGDEFQKIWENEDWWTRANNGEDVAE